MVRENMMMEIAGYFDEEVNERQLVNMVNDMGDYYELRAYGETLRFDKDTGGLI